jgi:hypothetical protein
MRNSAYLTALSTRQVLQALVLSHLDYCSIVWSGATKRDLWKIGIDTCIHTHNIIFTIHTYTWILLWRYVEVELEPEGTHLVCCEICDECIVMFSKLFNCLHFAGLQEE